MSAAQEPVSITGVHLFRFVDHVVVAVEIAGRWVHVIHERHDGQFSHIVEPNGIRAAIAKATGEA